MNTRHKDKDMNFLILVNTGDLETPVIVIKNNETKFAVEILDKVCAQYDAAKKFKMAADNFFHLLNFGVNALNIYRANRNYINVD